MSFRTQRTLPVLVLSAACIGMVLSVPACASDGNGVPSSSQAAVTTQLRCGESQLLAFDKQKVPENISNLQSAASDFAAALPPHFKQLLTEASKKAFSQLTKYQDDQLSPMTLVTVFNDIYLQQIDALAGHYLNDTNGTCPYVMTRLLDIVRGRYGLAMDSELSKWFVSHDVSSSDKMISAVMIVTAQKLAGKSDFSDDLILIALR